MSGPHCKVGIVAGGGSLPLEVARSVTARGAGVHVVMVEGAASEALSVYPHTRVNWAELGKACSAFERAQIRDIVLLGTYARPSFLTARPDLTFLRASAAVVRLLGAGGDDAVLRGLIGVFERHGLRVCSVADVVPELIVPAASLTSQKATDADRRDIELSFSIIGALGRFDIGQAVAIAEGKVLAIEGAEGTDRMLQRVAGMRALASQRSGVLVKCPKPGQDLRVDLPTIGPKTVLNADAARLNGIAVRAGQVLAAEREALSEAARSARIFVEGVAAPVTTGDQLNDKFGVCALGQRPLAMWAKRDAMRGAEILSTLGSFDTGTCVVIRDKRVLSIGALEPAEDVIGRVTAARRFRPHGVAVVRSAGNSEAVLESAARVGLAGVVFDAPPAENVGRYANTLRLFAGVAVRGRQE